MDGARSGHVLPDEAVQASPSRLSRRSRLGGTEGNEILTSLTAVVLIVLLAAEGITIVQIHGLLSAHMFIGFVLIPPVLLKLVSTGYRFMRYYTHNRPYVLKGPPALPLRLLAPVLVALTIVVFATGIALMAVGHSDGTLLFLHKLSFIAWIIVAAVHVLSYLPRVWRALVTEAGREPGHSRVPGSGVRGTLVAAAIGGGLALAVALLSNIDAWHAPQVH